MEDGWTTLRGGGGGFLQGSEKEKGGTPEKKSKRSGTIRVSGLTKLFRGRRVSGNGGEI